MASNEKRISGRWFVAGLITLIFLGAGLWFAIESQMPLLDSDQGKKFATNFEKHCMTRFTKEKCEAIAGTAHVKCYMTSAGQSDNGIVYDEKIYDACVWEASGMEAP